jgi:hypothetical protein
VSKRNHHPSVANYLGFGSEHEPDHLERYAPTSGQGDAPHGRSTQPRRRQARRNKTSSMKDHRSDDVSKNSRLQGFRVTKSTASVTSNKPEGTPSGVSRTFLDEMSHFLTPHAEVESLGRPSSKQSHHGYHSAQTAGCDFDSHTCTEKNALGLTSKISPTETQADNHNIAYDTDDLLDSLFIPSDLCVEGIAADEDDFLEDITDDDFLTLTSSTCDMFTNSSTDKSIAPAISSWEDEPLTRSLPPNPSTFAVLEKSSITDHSRRVSKQFVSPVTKITRILALTSSSSAREISTPIVRSPFPTPVRDRSPIIGLSSNTVLKTCFRIGEAINQSAQASKTSKHVLLELYARVFAADRTDTTQRLTLCDLFHVNPPYVQGVYDTAIWGSVPLFEYDAGCVLREGRLCRCIGRMKREGKDWKLIILNAWEATWDDVRWVEGIVDS